MIWEYDESKQPFKCVMFLHILGRCATCHIKWQYSDDSLVGFSFPYIDNADVASYDDAKDLASRFSLNHVNTCELEVSVKDEHSAAWLSVNGIAQKGTPGASDSEDGYFVQVNSGELCYGVQKKVGVELFISVDKLSYKRYILRRLDNRWDIGVIARKMSSGDVFSDFEGKLAKQIPQAIRERDNPWYMLWLPENQTPYIVTHSERYRYNQIGYSLLPIDHKAAVPEGLHYWDESDPRYAQMKLEIAAHELRCVKGDV